MTLNIQQARDIRNDIKYSTSFYIFCLKKFPLVPYPIKYMHMGKQM